MVASSTALSSSPTVEVLAPLPAGAIVRGWDGAIGTVERSTRSEVAVVLHDRLLGRGPWLYQRWQVEPATPAEASEYASRCHLALVEVAS
jgi:hypothetical protein